jgi:peptidoglycan/LPS O-acetylase OafA/YrhL
MQILSDHTPAPEVRLPSYERFREIKIFNSLDGLRCLSIVAVVWHHVAGHWLSGVHLMSVGYLGVDFFFVISGFLITTLLLREKEKYGRISLKNFYMRRSLRIFPLYYTQWLGQNQAAIAP